MNLSLSIVKVLPQLVYLKSSLYAIIYQECALKLK